MSDNSTKALQSAIEEYNAVQRKYERINRIVFLIFLCATLFFLGVWIGLNLP